MSAPNTDIAKSRENALDHIEEKVKDRNDAALPKESVLTTEDRSELRGTQPPASNPGSDDPTAGIKPGHGGLTKSEFNANARTGHGGAELETTQTTQSHLVARFNSVLGFTADSSRPSGVSAIHDSPNAINPDSNEIATSREDKTITQKAYEQATLGASALGGAAVAAVTSLQQRLFGEESQASPTQDYGNHTAEKKEPVTSSSIAPPTSASASYDIAAPIPTASSNTNTTNLPASREVSAQSVQDASQIQASTAAKMSDTETKPNPATDDSVPSTENPSTEGAKELHPTGHAPAAGVEGGKKSPENPDSIPSAGGVKLGKKAEGSSEVIPDLPPVQDGGAGVSSAAGQPTSQVEANTAANTGGATGGPGATTAAHSAPPTEHHGLVDKVKGLVHKE